MSAEFLLPEGITREAALASLRSRLVVDDGAVQAHERTYYDTFDGLLRADRLTVVHGDGRLALISLDDGTETASLAVDPPPERVLGIELANGPMRDALVSVINVRALLARVRVASTVQTLNVVDAEHKTVVRMTLEDPRLVASSQRAMALGSRLWIAGMRGYGKQLAGVERTLVDGLGFRPARAPVFDEAMRAAGRNPAGTASKVSVELAYDQRADAAAAAVLLALFEVVEANLEGAIADVDSEFLHDLRVAVRRSRAVQRELKGVFPSPELARFRSELRWLQQVTSDSRDLDVYVLEFDSMRTLVPELMRADLEPLLGVLRSRRLTARREMVRALRSDRAERLRRDWPAFLTRLSAFPDDDRDDATRPIGGVAGERIARVYRKMVKMGRAIDDRSPSEALHELRKKGKELRYMLELFGAPLYQADVVKPMVKTLKSLQDVLGRHQDREVQVMTIASLRDEVSALPGGAGALMAMGVLVERISADQLAARTEFAASFAEFASKGQRKQVEATFA